MSREGVKARPSRRERDLGYGRRMLETAVLIVITILIMIVAPRFIGRDDDGRP